MQLDRHFQNAYVTQDIDRAVETLREQHGVTGFKIIETTTEVRTPQGAGPCTLRLGLTWVGKLQYELIQPLSGMVQIYSDELSPHRLMKFHHVAMRVMEWELFRAKVEQQQLPIAIEGETKSGLKFLYLDARGTLGHHLEYIYAPAERWGLLDPGGVTG